MAQVTVRINGRGYDVACDDGQEAHLISLAEYVDGKVSALAGAIGQIGDLRLLLMTCLLVTDELSEARQEAARNRALAERAGAGADGGAAEWPGGGRRGPAESEGAAESVEELARRIEAIAARLERA